MSIIFNRQKKVKKFFKVTFQFIGDNEIYTEVMDGVGLNNFLVNDYMLENVIVEEI